MARQISTLNISWSAHNISWLVGARIISEMATRRLQDLDVMAVEKGGQRGHTGTTPTPMSKQNEVWDSAHRTVFSPNKSRI